MNRSVALAPLLAILLVGCTSTESPTAAPTSGSPSASVSASDSSPAASASADAAGAPDASAGGDAVPVGSPRSDEFVVSTVEEVKVGASDPGLPAPYSGALVRTCVVVMPPGQDVLTVSPEKWTMVGADGTTYPSKPSSANPTPAYPSGSGDAALHPAECAHGWIAFDVPTGADVATVRFMNQDTKSWVWSVK
ncbi:MAG TPA: hypothetical protein PK428_11855 [Phycicoccus sp.]|nr:hypothetical protein [Phycicoccus sp.]